eukprot:746838-Hanusia_phi.AAC.4
MVIAVAATSVSECGVCEGESFLRNNDGRRLVRTTSAYDELIELGDELKSCPGEGECPLTDLWSGET